MNSRTTRAVDSKPARSATHPGPKRSAPFPLEEPTRKREDSVPLLISVPPVRRRAQTTPCPMSPMTPDLDTDYFTDSPESSESSSTSSTFTFNLLSPTTPHHDHGLSFTICPSSPLDESTVYAFPPRKGPASASFSMRSGATDHSDLPIALDTPHSEDPLREGIQSPSDDRKYFHVQFLQEDSPFPKTPDC